MLSNLVKCSYCGSDVWSDEIMICEQCGKEMCPDCQNLNASIMGDLKVHSFHECNRNYDDCESRICYDDGCKRWNTEDHNDQTKSSYDENREFIMNLDPNDPADEWFFED